MSKTNTKQSVKKITALEAQNALFKKASRKQKRLMILEDALKITRSKTSNIQIETGSYFKFWGLDDADTTVNQLRLIKNKVECEVCAKGALFCSRIKLGNAIELEAFEISSDLIQSDLKNIFDEIELDLIESFFERRDFLVEADILQHIPKKYQEMLFNTDFFYDNVLPKLYSEEPKIRFKQMLTQILKADGNVLKALLPPAYEFYKRMK